MNLTRRPSHDGESVRSSLRIVQALVGCARHVCRAKRRFIVREALGQQPTGGSMRNLKKSWLPIYLFAAGVILNVSDEHSARAFTLIERLWLPAVQLIAGQSADIKVTNVSANSIIVELRTFRDNGSQLALKQVSIAPETTFTFEVAAPPNEALRFHAFLGSDTVNAAIADVMTFDTQTGQVMALLPFIEFDTK
jgi:hypothetical protein